MTSNAKVIPFVNDDLRVEELKEINYEDQDSENKSFSCSKPNGVGYDNFVKKHQENISKTEVKKQQSISSSKNDKSPLNAGTGGQDPNITIKSQTSISTKTGGDDYLNDRTVEDVRVGNKLLNQIKVSEWLSNYFAMTTISAGVIEYELATSYDDSNVIGKIRDVLLWVTMITTIMLIVTIISRYDLLMRWNRSTNQLTKYDNLINTGWYKLIMIELCIAIFSPYPFLKGIRYKEWNEDYGIDIFYEINHVFLAIAFLRFYLPVRLSLAASNYMTSRAQRLGVLNG